MSNNYIAKRLAALTEEPQTSNNELETLRVENAKLKQQLKEAPQADFKSEAQKSFEQSPQFEQLLNVFFVRFIRDKFGLDFRESPYMKGFQEAANAAFIEHEKSLKKEGVKNGSNGKKDNGTGSKTDAGETA